MFHDVRMRGFKRRADVDEVVAWVDALPLPREIVRVPVEEARGRVLAVPLVSAVNVPGFARAAMDGWAVRGEDTFGASETDPRTLKVVGRAMPGDPYDRAMLPGEAVRIMTGAPVPLGADSVLRAEDGREQDGELTTRAPVPTGYHVGAVGEDVAVGAEVLPVGRVLRPQDLGVASSIGERDLQVHEQGACVSIFVTGNEILPPGARPTDTHIADANGPMLRALVERDGGSAHVHYVKDDAAALLHAMERTETGLMIVTGGSSVGEEDHAPRLLHEHGTLAWHGVNLRPAAPVGMGTLGSGKRPVFLLPGNPVSALCAYDFFAGRYVRRAADRPPEWPYTTTTAPLARKIASVLGRVDYVRVRVVDGTVVPVMARGASILTSTTESDGFVIVSKDSEGWPEGREVTVHLYD